MGTGITPHLVWHPTTARSTFSTNDRNVATGWWRVGSAWSATATGIVIPKVSNN
jgi:hypothetical protein